MILNLCDCLRCLKLKKLEIIGNQIQLLTDKDFMSVFGTQKLLLRGNQIRRIDTDTFKPFNTSLLELDLSSNKITSINGSVKYLSNLRMLNLSYNSIEVIFIEIDFFFKLRGSSPYDLRSSFALQIPQALKTS